MEWGESPGRKSYPASEMEVMGLCSMLGLLRLHHCSMCRLAEAPNTFLETRREREVEWMWKRDKNAITAEYLSSAEIKDDVWYQSS